MREAAMSVRNLGCLGVSVLVALSWPALVAADGAPVRVRGEVQQLEGQTLTVQGRDGSPVVLAPAAHFAVSRVAKAGLDRKSVVSGKRWAGRVELGGRRPL